MSKIEPVAYANLSRWLSGREWPDDCLSERIGGDISDPLYTADALREIERRMQERCAKKIEQLHEWTGGHGMPAAPSGMDCAAAIRALPSEVTDDRRGG